ncbi:MAG: hypothetical protein M3Y37_02790 [Chloroflexota bacterium]|nr:hypothetical protein [Chloroflexota bacterium]
MALVIALILLLMRITAPAAAHDAPATPEPPGFETIAATDSATECDQIGLLVYENKLEEDVADHVNRICSDLDIEFILVHCWVADELSLSPYDIAPPDGVDWLECALIATNNSERVVLLHAEQFVIIDSEGKRHAPIEHPLEHERWTDDVLPIGDTRIFHVLYEVPRGESGPYLLEVAKPDVPGDLAGTFLLGDVLTWTEAFIEDQADD